MKRFLSFTPEIFCVIFLLLPFAKRYASSIASDMGYTLILHHTAILGIILAAVFLLMSVCLIRYGRTPGLFGSICCWGLPLFVFRWNVYLLCMADDSLLPILVTTLSILITTIVSAVLVKYYGRYFAAKIIVLLLTVLPNSGLAFLIFLCVLFAGKDFGNTTVLQTKPSPGGIYAAQIIECDQGALGLDSYLRVIHAETPPSNWFYTLKSHNVLYEKISDGHDHTVVWTDDHTLVVDGTTYEIP